MVALDSRAFFGEYHGHPIAALEKIEEHLRAAGRGDRAILFLVGDSTMDNKYWLRGSEPACNGYELALRPPRASPDVAHQINKVILDHGLGPALCAVNAAVEESTLGLRQSGSRLLPHDAFVRDHLRAEDVLCVSCGGNDVALRPTAMTAICMFTLVNSPTWLIKSGFAPGLGHFVRLFRDETTAYLEALMAKQRPKVVLACMLYYLDQQASGSWADGTLSALGYDRRPEKLQLVMRTIFERATSCIQLGDVPVVPVPLYEALDGADPADYVERVEPSVQGGAKLARLILDRLLPALSNCGGAPAAHADLGRRQAGEQVDGVAATMPPAVHSGAGDADRSRVSPRP